MYVRLQQLSVKVIKQNFYLDLTLARGENQFQIYQKQIRIESMALAGID